MNGFAISSKILLAHCDSLNVMPHSNFIFKECIQVLWANIWDENDMINVLDLIERENTFRRLIDLNQENVLKNSSDKAFIHKKKLQDNYL